MNNFEIDLQYSIEAQDNDMFDSFYKRIFPNLCRIEFCEDMIRQKVGIDKIIHFPSGNKFTIDEKKRKVDYGDIALEIWSNYEKKKRGWLYYSNCDYIIYAIMPAMKIYLLPTMLLKRAWYVNQSIWTAQCQTIYAQNKFYKTENICIPTDILLEAIKKEMVHEVNK